VRSATAPPHWKRVSDIVLGVPIALVLLVPCAVVAALIVMESGWPALICQRRIGRDGREFGMWKFRTMPVGTVQVAKSEMVGTIRTTRVGRWLRRFSVDELPQMINVLTGDMSLVGPRPALFNQFELTEMRRRAGVLAVKPGLTGLAQVSGREDLALERKVALDHEYVQSLSIGKDLSILVKTVGAVLGGRGTY